MTDSRLANLRDTSRGTQSVLQREATDLIIRGFTQLRESLEPSVEVERLSGNDMLRPYVFERARDKLVDAQNRYKTAVNALLSARNDLETKRAELLVEGVEGKNAESRDAAIRVQLGEEYELLERREAELNEARSELEIARLEWDTLRYQVRLLGVASSFDQPF
jgi:hypothetical protein